MEKDIGDIKSAFQEVALHKHLLSENQTVAEGYMNVQFKKIGEITLKLLWKLRSHCL